MEDSVREDILILTLNGQLTFDDAESTREKILSFADAGHLKVVVDLSHVFYIDSTGLGALVGCYVSLQKRGGALKLVNPNKRNLELLLVTQLHSVFEVFNEVQDAVNSFFPQRENKRLDFLSFIRSKTSAAR